MSDEYTCHHFSLNNALGEGQDDLPLLLRRLADLVEQLGDIYPRDLSMETQVTDNGLLPVVRFYYDRPQLTLVK